MCVGSRARVGSDGHRGGNLAVTRTHVAKRETNPRTVDQMIHAENMEGATMQRRGEGQKQGDTGERHQGKSRPDRKQRNEASFPEAQAPERSLTKEPASGSANVETLRAENTENKWESEGVGQSKASRLHAGPRRPLAAPSALPRDPHGKSRTQSVSS